MIFYTTIKALFENIIFLSTITSLLTAQVLKIVIFYINPKNREKKINILETLLWRTGGMPSSHSAVVCSLSASAGIKEGFSSNIFIISLVFAMIVIRDSLGVRRSAGIQAKTLNNLGKQIAQKSDIEFHSVKEIQGHTPPEVLAGSLLGIAIAVIYLVFTSMYN